MKYAVKRQKGKPQLPCGSYSVHMLWALEVANDNRREGGTHAIVRYQIATGDAAGTKFSQWVRLEV
jgi:hypothetical protein